MRFSIFLFAVSTIFCQKISINEHILNVEVVDTIETRAKGLMGRKELAVDSGMLFVYPSPQPLSFWMKNTLIPLSIAFIDEHLKIVKILDMDVPENEQDLPLYTCMKLCKYALEVQQGWFKNNGIHIGSKISFLD